MFIGSVAVPTAKVNKEKKVLVPNKEKVRTSHSGSSFSHTGHIIMLLCLKYLPRFPGSYRTKLEFFAWLT